MRVYLTIIAASIPMIVVSSAAAQSLGRAHHPAETRYQLSRNSLAPFSRMARDPIASPTFANEERFAETRGSVVGTLPVAENVNLQIGLLKVTGTRRGERPLARTEPLRDNISQGRIAAAGLNFRF